MVRAILFKIILTSVNKVYSEKQSVNNWHIYLDILERYKWLFLQDQTLRKAEKQKFETGVLTNFLNQMLTLFNQEKGQFMTGEDVSCSFDLLVHSFYIYFCIICQRIFEWKLVISCFVSLQMTWADIAVANLMDLCLKEVNIDKEKFGQLYSLMNQVFENPNIKKYLAARPKTKGWIWNSV